jgi:hypothetical protein
MAKVKLGDKVELSGVYFLDKKARSGKVIHVSPNGKRIIFDGEDRKVQCSASRVTIIAQATEAQLEEATQ